MKNSSRKTGSKSRSADKEVIAGTELIIDTDLHEAKSVAGAPITIRERQLGEFSALLLGVEPGEEAEAKTFPITPDPLVIRSTSTGNALWTMDTLRLSYIRARDPQTGLLVCFITLSMYQTGHGWRLWSGGNLHILSKTSQDGLLEDWDTGPLDARCGYNHSLKTYRKEFRPDWYDLVKRVWIHYTASTWHKCRT